MIKKVALLAGVLACVAISTAGTFHAAQERPTLNQVRQHDIKVLVNGNLVAFPDQAPMMVSNRVMVPLRGVFEELGATVNWDASKDLVTATRNGQTVELYIGKTTAMVGTRQLTLDQPATVVNGRAMVPLRFLAESLGATVDWRATDMTVTIKTAS